MTLSICASQRSPSDTPTELTITLMRGSKAAHQIAEAHLTNDKPLAEELADYRRTVSAGLAAEPSAAAAPAPAERNGRKALEDRPDTAVVFVSGYAEEHFADDQARIPNSTFLPKPFSLTQLTEAVFQHLN